MGEKRKLEDKSDHGDRRRSKQHRKLIHESGINSTSGISFAEAMGMCEPIRGKNNKKNVVTSTSSKVDNGSRNKTQDIQVKSLVPMNYVSSRDSGKCNKSRKSEKHDKSKDENSDFRGHYSISKSEDIKCDSPTKKPTIRKTSSTDLTSGLTFSEALGMYDSTLSKKDTASNSSKSDGQKSNKTLDVWVKSLLPMNDVSSFDSNICNKSRKSKKHHKSKDENSEFKGHYSITKSEEIKCDSSTRKSVIKSTSSIDSASEMTFSEALGMGDSNLNKKDTKKDIASNYSKDDNPKSNKAQDNSIKFAPSSVTADQLLERMVTSKAHRTKVYSGRVPATDKLPVFVSPSIKELQNKAIDIPHTSLKFILKGAKPNQLHAIESRNPYLIKDSDELWQRHCQDEFKNHQRKDMESWREMYNRCCDERESRLRILTENIKKAQEKLVPAKTLKMAYVDSTAKPPRNISRQHARNETENIEMKPIITPAVRSTSCLAVSGVTKTVTVLSSATKDVRRPQDPRKSARQAPLLAKSLSMYKGQLNRYRR